MAQKRKKNFKKTFHTRVASFPCVFELNENGGYTVTVLSLPGVITEGRNLKEAQKMIKEAISLHCQGLLNEDFPKEDEGDIVVGVVQVAIADK